ncbi:hypothetical protein [Dyella sp. S184]|uniref:hypothetical protein n=1 Tax=Dyella sp. S184 TaxID=1641862 RepID=UPI00131E0CF8|nr:hypothetical protein [Dyella sp. S184]
MTLEEPDFEKYKKHFEELAKTVLVKDGHIVINVHNEYNIALSSCNTHEKILGWVFHLTEKTWISRDVLRRFILVACHENGLKVPHS